MQSKEFYINSDGIRLHTKLDRPDGIEKGPLCILIHGFTGDMEEEHLIAVRDAMIDTGISVLRPEMYGHGGSDGEFKDHTLYKWITNAISVIDHARSLDFVTELILSGHSQGGLLTMLIGGMCPDYFKAIIPLSPAWMIPETCREGSLLGTAFDPDHIPETIISENEWEISGNYVRVAQTIRVEDQIKRYEGPVLIVHGDEDESVPFIYAEKAVKLYKNAELIPIRGAEHCFDGHLNELADVIRAFSERIKTGA